MDFKLEIEQKLKKLKLYITEFLSNEDLYKNFGLFAKDIKNKLLPFCLLGKNMRGLLVLLISVNDNEDSYKVSSALEILHSGLLIHDDIMDDDTMRRGSKCIHIQYQNELTGNSNQRLYGISQAICLGDIAFFLAFRLLSDLECKNSGKIREVFSREMVGVGVGQMSDVFYGFSLEEPSFADIINIYKAKTARYSISTPIVLGMYINDEREEFINLAFEIGESLGVLFQMKDDELGIWGDEKLTGKGLLGDVAKNKKTILRHLLFSLAEPKEKEKLESIFGKSYISTDDKHYLEFLFDKYDIKQKHRDIMKGFYDKMQADLNKLPKKYADVFNFVYKYNEERFK